MNNGRPQTQPQNNDPQPPPITQEQEKAQLEKELAAVEKQIPALKMVIQNITGVEGADQVADTKEELAKLEANKKDLQAKLNALNESMLAEAPEQKGDQNTSEEEEDETNIQEQDDTPEQKEKAKPKTVTGAEEKFDDFYKNLVASMTQIADGITNAIGSKAAKPAKEAVKDIKEAMTELKDAEAHKDKLTGELESNKEALTKLEPEVNQLKTELEATYTELHKLKTGPTNQPQNTQKIAELEKKIDTLDTEFKEKNSQLSECKKNIAEFPAKITEADANIGKAQKNLEQKTDKSLPAFSEVFSVLAKKSGDLKDAQKKVKSLKRKAKTTLLKSKVKGAESKLAAAESEHQEAPTLETSTKIAECKLQLAVAKEKVAQHLPLKEKGRKETLQAAQTATKDAKKELAPLLDSAAEKAQGKLDAAESEHQGAPTPKTSTKIAQCKLELAVAQEKVIKHSPQNTSAYKKTLQQAQTKTKTAKTALDKMPKPQPGNNTPEQKADDELGSSSPLGMGGND